MKLITVNKIIIIPELLIALLTLVAICQTLIEGNTSYFFLLFFLTVFNYLPFYGWIFIIPFILSIVNIKDFKILTGKNRAALILILLLHTAFICYISIWWITGQEIMSIM